jgi:hypothetical protein
MWPPKLTRGRRTALAILALLYCANLMYLVINFYLTTGIN